MISLRLGAATMAVALAACGSTPDALDRELDRWALSNSVASLSVAVIDPEGATAFYGASGTSQEPSLSALYEVGSLTKTMVSVVAILMASDGIVDLDAPIAEWLPDFPRADQITLRSLLTHTAGISDGSGGDQDLGDLAAFLDPARPAELLAAAAELVGDGPIPGPHRYANSGYWVVGTVLERAADATIESLIRQRILEPLSMGDTYAAWAEPVPRPLEEGVVAGPSGQGVGLGTAVVPAILTRAWSAGGVVSTALDMARFYAALFSGFLSDAELEELTTTPAGSDYGLGIERRLWQDGSTGWGHNGGIPGYTASAVVSDAGWTVVAMTNRFAVSTGGLDPDVEALVGVVLAALP